jgi:hypothetical protein
LAWTSLTASAISSPRLLGATLPGLAGRQVRVALAGARVLEEPHHLELVLRLVQLALLGDEMGQARLEERDQRVRFLG